MDTSQPSPLPLVPTQSVSQFTAAINVNEVLLTLGASRVGIEVTDGQLKPNVVTEWLVTLSISPSAAKVLQNILAQTLEVYEKQFGSIPFDKNANISVNTKP